MGVGIVFYCTEIVPNSPPARYNCAAVIPLDAGGSVCGRYVIRGDFTMPPSFKKTARRFAARMRTVGWCVLWFCLFASLWRAPVPCVHIHDESPADVRNAELREHVARFHVGERAADHHGWHVHFVTLRELLRGGGFPVPDSGDERHPDEMPVVLSLGDSRPSPAAAEAFLRPGLGDCAGLPSHVTCVGEAGGPPTSGSSRDFAVSLDRRLPLLCIARC
jgi:hypothetical protein